MPTQFDLKLKLHLLRQAEALLEHGSFSKAAEAMNLSQSTLSKGIREFEAQVGTQIFDRSRSPAALTDFGRLFMQQATELLHQATSLERLAEATHKGTTSYLRICLGPYAFAALAPRIVPDFAAHNPQLRLQVDSINPARAAELLRTQSADLVIAESSSLEAQDILADLTPLPGCVLVRKGHPLESAKDINMAAVSAFPSVQVTMLPPRILKPVLLSGTARPTKRNAASQPLGSINTTSLQLALDIVQKTDAYTFSTLGLARSQIEQGLLIPVLQEPWMYAKWSVARSAESSMPDYLLEFCEQLKQAHESLVEEERLLSRVWPIRGTAF